MSQERQSLPQHYKEIPLVLFSSFSVRSLEGKKQITTASKRAVRVSHASVFDAELVKETLGIAHEKFAEYKEMAEFLGSKRYSVDSLLQYYKEVFPFTSRQKGVSLCMS